MDEGRIHQVVRGERGITPDTAARFSLFFGTSVHFWLNLQSTYDAEAVVSRFSDDASYQLCRGGKSSCCRL
jgi:addiction module HigA family antidote